MRKHIEIIDFLMKKGLCSKQVLLVCSAVESLSNQQFSVVFVTILMLAGTDHSGNNRCLLGSLSFTFPGTANSMGSNFLGKSFVERFSFIFSSLH